MKPLQAQPVSASLETFRAPKGKRVTGGRQAARQVNITGITSVASRLFTFKENSNTPGQSHQQSAVVTIPPGAGFFVLLNTINGAFTTRDFQYLSQIPLGQFMVTAGMRGNNLVCTVRLTDANSDDAIFIEAGVTVVFFN